MKVTCLFVCCSLLLFGDFLVDIEDARDVEFHAVKVISNHCPQFIQTGVARFCNLIGRKQMSHFFKSYEDDNAVALPHLHNLPWHVQDATCCPAEEASQAGGGAISDNSTANRLRFPI